MRKSLLLVAACGMFAGAVWAQANPSTPSAAWRQAVSGAEPTLVVVGVPVDAALPDKHANALDCSQQLPLGSDLVRTARALAAVVDAGVATPARPLTVTSATGCNVREFSRLAFGRADSVPTMTPSSGPWDPTLNDFAAVRGIARAFREGLTSPRQIQVLVVPASTVRSLELGGNAGDVTVWRLRAGGQPEAVLSWRWQDLPGR